MALFNLEQRLAVNPFGSRIEINKRPEVISDLGIPTCLDPAVERCLMQFSHIKLDPLEEIPWQISGMKVETLTPIQIELFLCAINNKSIRFSERIDEKVELASYVTQLIQQSYNSGYNNFTLTPRDLKMYYLGYKLIGSIENPLKLSVHGNEEHSFGEESKHCVYVLKGNALDNCGLDASNCTFMIEGKVGELGFRSNNCVYIINKFNKAMYHICSSDEPRECIFATSIKNIFNHLIKTTSKERMNRVRLLGRDNFILKEVYL